MWNDIFNQVLINLQNVGIGMALFIVAYLANVCFSLYVNCKILGQKFDKNKLINSVLKIFSFGVGTALLCVSITTIPIFATTVGFIIPEEYATVFENLVIIGIFIISSCKYVMEAFNKMKNILDNQSKKD